MKINKNTLSILFSNLNDFNKNYFNPQLPILIKGLTNYYPAGKKWSIDYLKEYCGDVTIDLYDNSKKNNDSSAFTSPDTKMKFTDYIDTIVKDEHSDLRAFLFNMFKQKPELRRDFPCPSFFAGILGRIGYMFFGGKGIKVRIHQDIDMSNVLLTQFHGKKKVLLISPKYSELLYRLPFNTYSLIDVENPDYEKYPGLKYVEADEFILEPGDALFMPTGYWHYITYIEGGFSVSYRKMAKGFRMRLRGSMCLAVYMPFDKLMNKLLGKKWLEKKESIAQRRANKIIFKRQCEGETFEAEVNKNLNFFSKSNCQTN